MSGFLGRLSEDRQAQIRDILGSQQAQTPLLGSFFGGQQAPVQQQVALREHSIIGRTIFKEHPLELRYIDTLRNEIDDWIKIVN